MQSIFDDLKEYCKVHSIKINKGLPPEEIIVLEQFLDFSISNDFKEYLNRINGFTDFEWDMDLISFWSASRIIQTQIEYPNKLIIIADYSLECCTYGFFNSDEKIYIDYASENFIPKPVANNFSEFVRIYLKDKEKLFID